ncbi:coagulation factor XIII B chain [Pelobates cultripes]|uniref:Coagulation factor XIII B chain n=1 Tax=Pelobates cultripes TaxID=61616 RepID=A0AAD1W7R7_PELCU|nr:coagulation factor XIII B chain [Pelobates cultripes]CAH2292597.1 coagulation factor XIII B chain [Pelobates cultripes]
MTGIITIFVVFVQIALSSTQVNNSGQRCNRPEIADGQLYYYYYFPKQLGTYINYRCSDGFLPQDKRYYGRSYCTENGWNPKPKCTKFCDVTQLPVGKYEPDIKIFVVGETLRFECNNGFVIASGKTTTNIQCLQTGWSTFPRCIEYKCVVEGTNLISQRRDYKIGEVAQISCPPDYTLKGSELIQCYNNGWGPELPKCEQGKYT